LSELQQRLSKSANLVALHLQAKEASRFVGRDTTVPPGWLALARRSDNRVAVIPAGAELASQYSDALTMFRAGPVTLVVKAGPIRTADGHEIACTATMRVAVLPNANDLNALIRQFLSRSKQEVDAADIEKFLEEHVLVAARVFCRSRSTAENLSLDMASTLADHFVASLERPLLSVGLAIVPGMIVQCIPISEAAISFYQPASGGTGQEVLHNALLSQFEDLARKASDCGESKVGEALLKLRQKVAGQVAFTTFEHVMQVLPEKLRVELYEALLKIFATTSAERLVAAAGSHVICWRLPETGKPAWTTVLPADMGGCRSVRVCRDLHSQTCVLVGCQRGVVVMEAATGKPTVTLQEPYRGPQQGGGGFNSAILQGKRCWASKSDVGLLCWDLDRPSAPWSILTAGKSGSVRFVRSTVVDPGGGIWFGADNWLVNCSTSGVATAPDLTWFVPVDAAVTCVEVDGEDIWVGTQSGSLWRISQYDPRSFERQEITPGQAVEAVTIRRTGLVRWIIYADGKSAVVRTVNGMYTRNFTGAGGIRAARTGGTWLAGLSDWRDELFLWNCGSLHRDVIRLNIQRIANQRIQDFDLG